MVTKSRSEDLIDFRINLEYNLITFIVSNVTNILSRPFSFMKNFWTQKGINSESKQDGIILKRNKSNN
jgi:hypothetical protein